MLFTNLTYLVPVSAFFAVKLRFFTETLTSACQTPQIKTCANKELGICMIKTHHHLFVRIMTL